MRNQIVAKRESRYGNPYRLFICIKLSFERTNFDLSGREHLGNFLKKVPLDPSKTFLADKMGWDIAPTNENAKTNASTEIQVILRPSQNDVKFSQTNAVKVLIQLFQKLAGCGAAPHIKSPTNSNLSSLYIKEKTTRFLQTLWQADFLPQKFLGVWGLFSKSPHVVCF